MNLLSGLEKFGLDQMDTDHLFEEEKSDTPARKAPCLLYTSPSPRDA